MDGVMETAQDPAETTTSEICIRDATANDIPQLDDIERSAATLYKTTTLSAVTGGTLGAEALLGMLRTGAVWVARCGDEMAGFAACSPSGRALHLQELSVCARFQRRGIGRMLLRHVLDRARALGFDAVTLCTFCDVAWCQPFYESAGFRVVEEPVMGAELRDVWRRDRDGLPGFARVAMMLSLGA